ncbi:MAG: RNA pyrophosphohydrolase [Pseudorhodoplanes sp.]
MSKSKSPSLPYRPCVGVCVINHDGLIFIGRRRTGPEQIDERHAWQMPQGGIDDGEDPYAASLRELHEETNIRSVERVGEIAEWLTYDLPAELVGQAWGGKYRGQKQLWFALRFTGHEDEIDIENPGGGHKPEFVAWRWAKPHEVAELVVPFKRPLYERILHDFSGLLKGKA